MENIIRALNEFVWGPPMLVLLLGTGLYLTIGLRLLSVSEDPVRLRPAVQETGPGRGR
jgi:AGCS family alanine or glycine:cation symporter